MRFPTKLRPAFASLKFLDKVIRPQVGSLTLAARGPASRFLPFGLCPQTKTTLRLSNPNAHKAVYALSYKIKARFREP